MYRKLKILLIKYIMNINWNLLNINKINLKSKKILFLGYGAVAKCVLNYFNYYFECKFLLIL